MGFSTFATEYQRLQSMCGVSTAANSDRYKDAVNDAILHIMSETDWPWMKAPYESAFNCEATYATGTISTTVASTSVTGSGTLWDALTGTDYEVLIGNEVYGFTKSDDTNATLSRAALATLSGVTYTVFRRVYPLAARMRSLDAAWAFGTQKWPLTFRTGLQMAVDRSWQPVFGTPQRLGFVDIDSSDVSKVLLDPAPSAVMSVHYSGYQEVAALTSDGSVIPMPSRYQPAFRALAEHYMWTFRNDQRSVMAYQKYERFIGGLVRIDDPSDGQNDRMVLDPNVFYRGHSSLSHNPPRLP